ncbi:40S ribosomal protein S12-like [Anastrepha obliqua]|uniref:40S ribosomal protein S12-like n=1 Tax=Anastrepha obliqua TaxID=95512 RepID=UPI002408F4BD|nr:40S ribosomal protein S12-like [Anastrepha obliqua]
MYPDWQKLDDLLDVDVSSAASVIDINTALQKVLKKSLIADRLVHGMQSFGQAPSVLCILTDSTDVDLYSYKKLVTALCHKHQISLVRVDSHKKLREWSVLCKINAHQHQQTYLVAAKATAAAAAKNCIENVACDFTDTIIAASTAEATTEAAAAAAAAALKQYE